jgi:hypothetical protein
MNGKPGDHPITDIVRHRIARYGDPLDSQIRQLGELMSYHRLCDWFEQHWSRSRSSLSQLSRQSWKRCDVPHKKEAGKTSGIEHPAYR